ncbi:MAG: riboflavin biosynthesis protein RibF [Clostridiales bacterium]|nr:riboflavin biosynthesis protein RibF [Clostridiales bacterium]
MIKVINYGEKSSNNLILALGYFDALHKGHTAVLEKTVQTAKGLSLTPAVLIFRGGKSKTDLFTLEERIKKIETIGVELVIVKSLDSEFMGKTKQEFLYELSSLYKLEKVVSGSDFTFGKNASGNVQTLNDFFGIDRVITLNLVGDGNNKISTSEIKKMLSKGDIKLANESLGSPYFISETVVKGKELGQKLGFPTANIILTDDKFKILPAVYKTKVVIEGREYFAITNFGSQPTVSGDNLVVETHILGFNGNLYGKELTVYFLDKIRDIKKFNSIDELKAQLELDKEY